MQLSAERRQTVQVAASDVSRLRGLLVDQKTRITLRDGTRVSGTVVGIDDRDMTIQVERSNGPGALPTGQGTVAIERVSQASFTAYKGRKRVGWATFLGAIGLGIGYLYGVSEIGGESATARDYVIVASLVAAGAGAGYLHGRKADRVTTTVLIK